MSCRANYTKNSDRKSSPRLTNFADPPTIAESAPAAEAEEPQGRAEIGRQRRMRADRPPRIARIRQFQRGRMEHLPRNLHQPGVAGGLEPEDAVADDGEANRRQMTADLVGAPRLDAYAQQRRVGRRRLARHPRDCRVAPYRSVDRLVLVREAPRDYARSLFPYAEIATAPFELRLSI